MDSIILHKSLKTGKKNKHKSITDIPLIISDLAEKALMDELYLSPKPGLVDRINSGAHDDMDIELMENSIYSIKDSFRKMSLVSLSMNAGSELRKELSNIGIVGEKQMKETTNNVNTHKGALWNIGLLISSATLLIQGNRELNIASLCNLAGEISRIPLLDTSEITHGKVVKNKYGYLGARGEAWNNFYHVQKVAYPFFREQIRIGHSHEISSINTLIKLIGVLDDTCILYRSNPLILKTIQTMANSIIEVGGISSKNGLERYKQLDDYIMGKNVSPGGSADLLGATLFIDYLLCKFA